MTTLVSDSNQSALSKLALPPTEIVSISPFFQKLISASSKSINPISVKSAISKCASTRIFCCFHFSYKELTISFIVSTDTLPLIVYLTPFATNTAHFSETIPEASTSGSTVD